MKTPGSPLIMQDDLCGAPDTNTAAIKLLDNLSDIIRFSRLKPFDLVYY